MKLVNPANKRRYEVIVVGSGLAGASAAASLAELGYHVSCFCFQDSPRRAHSIAAQGGINAAKNYQNDGDSVYRLFYDTIKGGDFRSRDRKSTRLNSSHIPFISYAVFCLKKENGDGFGVLMAGGRGLGRAVRGRVSCGRLCCREQAPPHSESKRQWRTQYFFFFKRNRPPKTPPLFPPPSFFG